MPIKKVNWSCKTLVKTTVYTSVVPAVPPKYFFLSKLTHPYILAWPPSPLLKEIRELFF
jgi:hypothetical protein